MVTGKLGQKVEILVLLDKNVCIPMNSEGYLEWVEGGNMITKHV